MTTMTKLPLVAALILATSSVAMAATNHHRTEQFQTRSVSAPVEAAPTAAEENWMDRASESYGGGGY